MILLDTSGLLAALDASQRDHRAAATALRAATAPRILSPFVLAELDYLLSTRVNSAAQDRLLEQVESGVYRLESLDGADVARARVILERYRDLGPGIADASIVVLAERHDSRDVLTLDERHFRALRGPGGQPFRLLPADA
ncbi:MAG: type II toxin-antitoxin system VapC family toxin [Candidatus Limnocylindrales bacterium]